MCFPRTTYCGLCECVCVCFGALTACGQGDVMRVTVEEMLGLDRAIMVALQHCQAHPEDAAKPEMAAQVMVHHVGLQRNKRLCLAYLHERLVRIKRLAWELGYVPEKSKPNMTLPESDFFNDYTQLLREHAKHFDSAHFTLDLCEDLQQPPSDLFVEVRVRREVGEVFTEEGPVYLHMGTQHTMRRSDAEPYIRQGKLEQHL